MLETAELKKAYSEALKARLNAHAPYSNFLVGACLKIKGQDTYISGCNVENASFGATVCAERTAFQRTIAELGKVEFDFLVVVTNTDPAIGPCGLCLQVISEFCHGDFPVYIANLQGLKRKVLFKDLLSNPFSKVPDQCKN